MTISIFSARRYGEDRLQKKLKLNKPLQILLKLIVYSTFYYSLLWVLDNIMDFHNPSVAFLITISIIIVYRGKLTRFTQKVIDRSFYLKLYRLRQASDVFISELNTSLEFVSGLSADQVEAAISEIVDRLTRRPYPTWALREA